MLGKAIHSMCFQYADGGRIDILILATGWQMGDTIDTKSAIHILLNDRDSRVLGTWLTIRMLPVDENYASLYNNGVIYNGK